MASNIQFVVSLRFVLSCFAAHAMLHFLIKNKEVEEATWWSFITHPQTHNTCDGSAFRRGFFLFVFLLAAAEPFQEIISKSTFRFPANQT